MCVNCMEVSTCYSHSCVHVCVCMRQAILCRSRLDDVCSRVAHWQQELGHLQLALSVGLPRLLQLSLGRGTRAAAGAVICCHLQSGQTQKAVARPAWFEEMSDWFCTFLDMV